jgi:hypothetical protein
VTGTTTITAITLAAGDQRTVRFTGALTLTHGASLVLPGSASITTAAGDYAIFRGYSSGVVRCVHYGPLAGLPVNRGGTGAVTAPAAFDALTKHGADVASASTINLTTATGVLVDVTGTTAITAITLAEGLTRVVRFTGALTLTNGASLVLPGGADIITVAGDCAVFVGYAAGVVRCVSYSKIDGLEAGICLSATNTLTSSTALQSLFDSVGTGAITLPTGLFAFEGEIHLTSMHANSGNGQIDLLGAGGATPSSWSWSHLGCDGAAATVTALNGAMNVLKTSAAVVLTATTETALHLRFSGTVRVTVAGTFIPSIALTDAAAAVVGIGSGIRFKKLAGAAAQSWGPVA